MEHLTKIFAGVINLSPLPQISASSSRVQTAFNLVAGIAASIAVLIITLAGLRYITSQGNPQTTAQAKNAILYASIGIVVIIFAFVIVNFVVVNL
jgi:uncharacterized membrane protein YidH (DUF202 family)